MIIMEYYNEYLSPLGKIILKSDGTYLTGLCFSDKIVCKKDDLDIFNKTKKWLDIYFDGENPNFSLNIKLDNVTAFQRQVLNIVQKIPYGERMTYGMIAQEIEKERNIKKMSSQAVGNAVGHNPICIVIPCHRVIGANNNLVGYRYGLLKKKELLKLEHCEN